MKTYELKPTQENLFRTYEEDAISRNTDIFRFIEILTSLEDSCSIALDGRWGSGKTFFVKQVKMVLDAHNDFVEKEDNTNIEDVRRVRALHYQGNEPEMDPQVCVYYDAWENDSDEDPVLSLVYTILKSVNSDFSFKSTSFIDIASNILEIFEGKNISNTIKSLKGNDPLATLKKEKDVAMLVEDFLTSLLPEKGNRLVVFVDELDRCKPTYAVRLLERIKHYFCNDRITFVFSVNICELQKTIRQYYGSDFDGSRYLDRFFDLRISLAPPDMDKFYRSLGFAKSSSYFFEGVCYAVIQAFHFELREIAKYIKLTKIAAYEPTHDRNHKYNFVFSDEKATLFCLYFIVPIMTGLKICDVNRYRDFVEGNDYSPFLQVANRLEVAFLRDTLESDESFEKNAKNTKVVTVDEKVKAIYDAIFVETYTGHTYKRKIGQLEFNGETKDAVMRATGLLSYYSNIDVD